MVRVGPKKTGIAIDSHAAVVDGVALEHRAAVWARQTNAPEGRVDADNPKLATRSCGLDARPGDIGLGLLSAAPEFRPAVHVRCCECWQTVLDFERPDYCVGQRAVITWWIRYHQLT
jgi:hypothetical protein